MSWLGEKKTRMERQLDNRRFSGCLAEGSQQLQHIGYMEIIKSFWKRMTNVCACVYMVDICLRIE
jgi:hypothetical protein